MVEDPGDVWFVLGAGHARKRLLRAIEASGLDGAWPIYWRLHPDGSWVSIWFAEQRPVDDVIRGEVGLVDPAMLRAAGESAHPPSAPHLSAWSRAFAIVPTEGTDGSVSVEEALKAAVVQIPATRDALIARLQPTPPYAARHPSHVFALVLALEQEGRYRDLEALRSALDDPAWAAIDRNSIRDRLTAGMAMSGRSPLPIENQARLIEVVGSRLASLAPISLRGGAVLGPGRTGPALKRLANPEASRDHPTILLRLCFAPPSEDVCEAIRQHLATPQPLVRRRAALALGVLGDEYSFEGIRAILRERSPWPFLSPDAADLADAAFGLLALSLKVAEPLFAKSASADLHQVADRLYGRPRPDIRRYANLLAAW